MRGTPFLAIVDQSVYALTNLALQIVVARSVSAEEFGAYTFGSTFFFVAALLHQSLIIEPMFVYSTQRYGNQMTAYHARLRQGWSVAFSVSVLAAGLGISIGFLVFGSPLVAKCVAAFAFISPVLLYLWLLRRIAFILARIDLAIVGGGIYGITLCGMAVLVWHLGDMSAAVAICLSGIAAAIASIIIIVLLPRPLPHTPPPGDMVYQHLRYGRWAVGSEAVNWCIANGPIVVLPIWFGLSAVGTFRIINLLFMPLLQITAAMSTILLRRFATRRGEASSLPIVLRFVWMLLAGATLYSLAAVLFGPLAASILFGSGYIIKGSWLLLSAVSITCVVASQAFFTALRAREKSHQVLVVHVTVLVILICLLPEVAASGISGLLFAQAIAWGLAFPLAGALTRSGVQGQVEDYLQPEPVPPTWP